MASAPITHKFEKRSAEVEQQEQESAEALEHAYEAWFHHYLGSGVQMGVYAPSAHGIAICLGKPKNFNSLRAKLKWLTFFPDSKIPSHRWFASDSDAVFNDWVMVGSDLYGAIQQFKIESPHVRPEHRESGISSSSAR
jgi:hypothetical protein